MDKVDTYDKEQLQAMGWLFDETETPDTAVRFVEQDLTSEQQMQVFKNLGWDVYVTDSKSFLGSTLTPEEIERLKTTSAIILTDLNKIFLYGGQSGDYIRFYGMDNNTQFGGININPSTGFVGGVGSYRFLDVESVHFTKQTLTIPQQNQALGNIGLDFVRIPHSLLGTTLSDEMFAVLDNARGIIVVNTSSNYDNPTVFIKGVNSSTTCFFVSHNTGTTYCQIQLNKSTKILSNISAGLTYAGSVRYAEEQSLANTQKDTVLSNIGLNWIHVQYSLLGTTLDDATYTKLTNAFGIILTDAPSDYFGPRELICSANNRDGVKVFAGLNLADTSAYIVLYVNHNLTTVRYARTYDGAVPYDMPKTLTSAQQDVALSNIGLDFVHVDYALLNTTLDDSTAARIENAKGIILTNTPENYSKASVFLKANYYADIIYFNAWGGVSLVSQFYYNTSTKKLTAIGDTDLHFDSIRYGVSQDLTDARKQQARSNIGVQSADELLADDDFIAQLKTKLGL